MKILSHRGFWRSAEEKNTLSAFEFSRDNGFGTETDVRDLNGRLVISHDIPNQDALDLYSFLEVFAGTDLPVALNIKADGLSSALEKAVSEYDLKNAFVFDMSVPDMRSYFKTTLRVFGRFSEVEPVVAWVDSCEGIWLDAFESTWYTSDDIKKLLDLKKHVCIVSPELHSREYESVWQDLKGLNTYENLMLCTDHPDKASVFFGV